MLGEFPAVYDFAASQHFKAADIPDKAVFYLHGQRTGFVLLNTQNEVEGHSKRLGPIFDDAGRGRLWIVVGYSGESDPVFDHLARVERFDNGLYWIGYQEGDPPAHVRERLLLPQKDAFFVPGFDANSFFINLTQKLRLFPPTLIARPFSHLRGVIESLTPYRLPGQTSEDDVTRAPLGWIEEAIQQYELYDVPETAEPRSPDPAVAATSLLMQGEYDRVVALHPELDRPANPELADAVSWAHVMLGNGLLEQALQATGEEADRLFQLAGEKYAAALAVKPDKHAALNNWATTLAGQAKIKAGEEADRLFQLAGEKYAAALAFKPDMHDAPYNWGNALVAQAITKSGEEADRLLQLAGEKYAAALAIKPDKHDAFNNWGNALTAQAQAKVGEEADRLFQLAGEKYAAVLAVKPDKPEVLYNWGNALVAQAKVKVDKEADRLFQLAGEKYAGALAIKPDMHRALNNWGNALADQARTKVGDEADRLLQLAGEKYAEALAIMPDKPEALNNWGTTLADQAKTKTGEEADRLLQLAGEKYAAALTVKPDMYGAFNNWGNALADQAKTKVGELADRLLQLAGEKYAAALAINPDMQEALNSWSAALLSQADLKDEPDRTHLLELAEEKAQAANALGTGFGAYNIACVRARLGDETGSRRWLEVSQEAGRLPAREHLETDPDLESVRGSEWFQKLLANL